MALTDLQIKKLKPASKPKKIADSEGLYLLVNTNGTKSWRLKYRYLGKEKTLSFGIYPEISLQEARNKKIEARKQIREGKDPSQQKKEQQLKAKFNSDNSFKGVAEEWYELNKHKWTPKHSQRVWGRLENHVFPAIGKRPISEIHALELLEDIIRKIEREGKIETAHRILQYCTAIFRFAIITKRAKYNPTQDLRGALKPHKKQNHPTIKIGEVPELLKRLENHKTAATTKLAIKMLLLTFVRQGELRQAMWEQIDLKKKIWYIPAHIMKMREEHIVPLSKQVIEILHQLKTLSGENEYLFPTQNKVKHPMMNENTINIVLKAIGYEKRLTAHGFRSLASTTLNELGFAPDVIERQLAHAERNAVRAAYNRAEYLPQRSIMMQEWADYIDGLKEN